MITESKILKKKIIKTTSCKMFLILEIIQRFFVCVRARVCVCLWEQVCYRGHFPLLPWGLREPLFTVKISKQQPYAVLHALRNRS